MTMAMAQSYFWCTSKFDVDRAEPWLELEENPCKASFGKVYLCLSLEKGNIFTITGKGRSSLTTFIILGTDKSMKKNVAPSIYLNVCN